MRFRLRGLLAAVLAVGLAAVFVPRMQAAFRLQSTAAAFANYALCMVGPTGPSLLRGQPREFEKLVRRRLITAAATDRPFATCAKMAREADPASSITAHEAEAMAFREYGDVSDDAPRFRVADLGVTTRDIARLSSAAWPFVRGGYTSLILPSAFAAEAAHPAEVPRPGLGRGALPARLTLGSGRCAEGPFALSVSADKRYLVARSFSPSGVETSTPFASADARVVAAACDEETLVVAVGRPGTRQVALSSCARLGACTTLELPRLGARGPAVRYPLDVARVQGGSVVAVAAGGIVRVASTRDGRTWTPFTVAVDGDDGAPLRSLPDKLFVSGKRLFLLAVPSARDAAYPLLVSDDAGASFHAP